MLKRLCLLLVTLITTQLWASEVYFTYDRYKSLSNAEKERIIVKAMELMVELESKYQKHVASNGFDPELYRRYSSLMKAFGQLFISSAHAQAPGIDWEVYANNFIDSVSNQDGNRCYYGGWISRAKNVKTNITESGVVQEQERSLCLHPLYLETGTPERTRYESTNGECPSSSEISCNPAIFGYKHVDTKTLFCVPSGRVPSYNASYGCMKLALDPRSGLGVSSKDERLADLREKFNSNPRYVQELFNFVYTSCVCPSGPAALEEHNLGAIRPHRTCLGMMQMLSEISNCELPAFQTMDTSLFQNLRDHALNQQLASQINPDADQAEDINAHYRSFLSRAESTPEFARLCRGEAPQSDPPETQEYSCEVRECQASTDAPSEVVCEIVGQRTGSEEPVPLAETTLTAAPGAEVEIALASDTNVKVRCSIPQAQENSDPQPEVEEPQASLTIVEKSRTDTHFTAEGNLTNHGDLRREDIKWWAQGKPGQQTTGIADDGSTGKEDKGKGAEKEVPRESADYQLCAEINDISGGCITVPKLEATPPVDQARRNFGGQVPPMGGQPPQMMRPAANTSAQGIR